MKKGKFRVISGPGGVGKDTIAKELVDSDEALVRIKKLKEVTINDIINLSKKLHINMTSATKKGEK